MTRQKQAPGISVLMPAYNAERYILQSVQSVLGQTREDFELIVVDDCSSDRTGEILAGIADDRLRIVRNAQNLGVVGSLNRAMGEAAGRYIARIDADDYCLPTRFAKQSAFLDQHPGTMIVGSEMSVLKRGAISFTRERTYPDPQVIRWMLHVGNPIGHPSMMFRAEAVEKLGCYLREPFKYAEDFDFSHRVLQFGEISIIPEYLVTYRLHDQNLTLTHRSEMVAKTAAVLRRVYENLLGPGQDDAASLVARHVLAWETIDRPDDFERLGAFLNSLVTRFCDAYRLDDAQRSHVIQHAGKLWWQLIQLTLRTGRFADAARHHGHYRWSRQTRPPARRLGRSTVSGLMRWALPAATGIQNSKRSDRHVPADRSTTKHLWLNDAAFRTLPLRSDDPPSLYVVVDTEAEFDWGQDFERSATSVSAMSRQKLAQEIFDQYGLRPMYLIDYAVASQPDGFEPLRAIQNRHGCVIGAHLHPWINPPLEEDLSERNSFAGNLPAELEERKLQTLVAQIQASFNITPLFFKAGRYGMGPNTIAILDRAGFVVDFSIMPITDMRKQGGPDFRSAKPRTYQATPSGILSVPMTRYQTGLLARMPQRWHGAVRSRLSQRLHLPGILSRLRLVNMVTLTPEGVTAAQQIALIKSMLKRGHRTFVLHYHSPSLGMHTPYVRNQDQLESFLDNISEVCSYFFSDLGGHPGNPADLVPQTMRNQVWPLPDSTAVRAR